MLAKKKQSVPKLIRMAAANGGGQANQSLLRRLTLQTSLVTGVGGRTRTTDVTSATEWSNLIQVYSEFRVLAIKAHIIPRISTAQAAPGPSQFVVTGIDRSGVLASPASALATFGLQGAKVWQASGYGQPRPLIVVEARAVDLEDQLFSPITVIPANFAVQYFNATPATMDILVEFMVEFRGLTG